MPSWYSVACGSPFFAYVLVAQARSRDAGGGISLPARVNANVEAPNAGADPYATLPDVQANAGEQFD